jgi:hypothetical protein
MISERSQARYTDVLTAAMREAEDHGYTNITRDGVAKRAGRSSACVNQSFDTIANLKTVVMWEAIKTKHLKIIAQGLAQGDEIAKQAPEDLRIAALSSVI